MSWLVTLYLLICAGTDCRTESIVGAGNITGCQLYAQHVAASWPLQPGERVAGWKCLEGEGA